MDSDYDDDDDENDLDDVHVRNEVGAFAKGRAKILRPLKNITQTCKSVVRANAGLLLVASSQAFFALMNVAVKKLKSLDTPVPTLEVSVCRRLTYIARINF